MSPHKALLVAVCAALFSLACATDRVILLPANFPEEDATAVMAVDGGRFTNVDGFTIDATELLVTPGERMIVIEATTLLNELDPAIDGGNETITCGFKLLTEPREVYAVRYLREANPVDPPDPTQKSWITNMSVQNETTGKLTILDPKLCYVRWDCRALREDEVPEAVTCKK